MNVAREWAAFAGAMFALMGLSLAASARRSAGDALAWERQRRVALGAPEAPGDEEPRRRRLTLAHRAGGLFFAAAGVALLILAAAGRAPFPARASGREALFGGIFFTACGAALAVNAWLRRGRRAPRFLEGELQPGGGSQPIGERVTAACSYGMIGLFLVFGLRLLREGLR
jgi:hypothetical protein